MLVSLVAYGAEPGYEVGARVAGLAGVTTTTRGDGGALFGNPALLNDGAYSVFALDASQGALSVTLPLRRLGTIGLGALDLSNSDRFLIDRRWNPLGTFETGRNRVAAGYAVALHQQLSVGATYDGWRFADDNWASGFSAGLIARPHRLIDVGVETHYRHDGRWATRYGLRMKPDRRAQLRVEGARNNVALGLESVWRYGSVRAGIRVATRGGNLPTRMGAGASLHFGGAVLVHYAYGFETRDFTGGTHRVSIDVPLSRPASVRVGSAPAPALSAPLEAVRRPERPPSSPKQTAQAGRGRDATPLRPRRIVESAVDRRPDIPSRVRDSLRELITHHSAKYGIEAPLILALIRAESGFNPNAVSSSKAVGLFQLMPPAARDMGIRLRDRDLLDPARDRRFDPIVNADAGIRYLAHLLNRFSWNYVLALAAYNAGPGRVENAGEVPQRRETERYVGKVLNFYFEYRNDPEALRAAWRRVDAVRIRS